MKEAEAQVRQAQAERDLAETMYQRNMQLFDANKGAVSKTEIDTRHGTLAMRDADLDAAKASLTASQTVLLELVKSGIPRQKAYGIVQKTAMQAWEEQKDFVALVCEVPEVRAVVSNPAILREKARVSAKTADLLLRRAFRAL